MGRGIGNRQKKVVAPKKAWTKERPPTPTGSKFQVPGFRKLVKRKP